MSLQATETIRLWRRTRFEWGTSDCILSVCDYVQSATGIDPAAPWRGTYTDEAGALAITAAHGGVLGLFRHGMALAGFRPCTAYSGAPVVCNVRGKEVTGILSDDMVAFRMVDKGVIEIRAEILEAWAI